MSRARVVEDSYALSPMQEGMLFHSLLGAQAGVDVEQMILSLREPLDAATFERAWRRVAAEHAILRTSFRWRDVDEPRQEVLREVELAFAHHDLGGLAADEVEARIGEYLREDRRRGFDLAEAPLQRFAIFRVAAADFRVVWTFHHIVLDGRSCRLVLIDAFSCYEAYAQGREPSFERRRPFRDYIDWLARRDASAASAFWRETLRGFRAPTPLPGGGDAVRAGGEGGYGVQEIQLSAAVTAALHATAERGRFTLNTLVQGAWALLLARHSGETDVVFGATRACRRSALGGEGTDTMVGMLINTVPVRVSVQPERDALAWLSDLRASWRALRDHEHTPLVDVQKWSDLPAGAPIFDTILVFEDYQFNDTLRAQGGGWRDRSVDRLEQTSSPLTLVGSGGDELLLRLEHERRRLDDAAASRLLGHLATLLGGFAEGLDRRLRDLPMLPDEERRALLVAWNDTRASSPRDRCVHQLFEAQAARTPEAIAVSFEGRAITYRELARRSNRLARYLVARGVGREALVGVSVARSIEMVVALYGILAAGGAYVPIDPAYPRDRRAFMVADAELAVLVTEGDLAADLPEHGAAVVRLDADRAAIEAEDDAPLGRGEAGSLAYVIYTSGSTGRPKGVQIEHRAVVNFLASMRARPGLGAADRLLAVTSISFDIAGLELFLPLSVGARVVLASGATAADGAALRRCLDEGGITAMQATPSTWRLLLEAGWEGSPLLMALVGGEAVPRDLADALVQRAGAVWNMYGPTETTIWSCIHPLTTREQGSVSIGRPIANTRVLILDRDLGLAPIGAAGELHIGGDGLARGYLRRPELTAERFIDDPFGGPGDRLYKTGDLCRRRADGNIEFLGRIDHQVKVRGYRIELGEIEAVLADHPAIDEAVAVVREGDGGGDPRLVAYLVCAGTAPAAAELRGFLAERLPEFMVPSAFVALEQLPLTANGKVDRRALPAPDAGALASRAYVAPRGPIEEALAGIFAGVLRLGAGRVGAHDGFFELGGHSLLGTQVISRVRAAFGVELPLRALFEAKTPADLAVRVVDALHRGRPAGPPPIERGPRAADGEAALSFAQERLWFLDQLEPGDPAYVVPFAVRLVGALDAAALGRAFGALVKRHAVLRTTFAAPDGRPVQIVHDDVPFALANVDLTALSADDRDAAVTREATREARRAFDLATGPLLRARLLRLAEREHVLVLTMHHIVSDAWTLGIMNREIAALYEGFRAGRAVSLPELPVEYADYARWQRRWLEGEVLARQLAYWKEQLAGAPRSLDLPADRPRPPVQTHRGARRPIALPAALGEALAELSRREGATLFMTLLAAFDVLLHRRSGQGDLLVGTPIANRTRGEIEGVMGFFLNTLVLRTEVSDDPTFRDLVRRVKDACLGAYAHQDVPFERLVQVLEPERDLGRSPLFQVMFTLQNASAELMALPGIEASGIAVDNETTKFDLTLWLAEGPEGIAGSIEYSADLFEAATIDRMAAELAVVIAGAVADPERRVSELPLLPGSERRAVVSAWNDTAGEFPARACVADLFEAQAARSPESVAVSFEGRALTYRALEEQANRLAHHLIALGAGADVPVGVCVERSIALVVGILAIFKAGGACVALDPEYPADRLAFMVEDTRLPVILTQASLAGALPPHRAAVVRLDADAEAIERRPRDQPARAGISPESLAYLIYTSGSTGRPKGVAMTQRPLVNLIAWQSAAIPGPRRTLQFASPSFDVCFQEIFTTWCTGGELILIADLARRDAERLLHHVARERVERLFLPPVALAQLADAAAEAPATRLHLREVIAAGEQLHVTPRVAALFARLPGCALHNHYGPSETHVVTELVLRGDPAAWPAMPGIGRPIRNVRTYVLDARMEPAPIGVTGELYLGGAQIARGYLDRPELTAERFVPDPFGGAGDRLYRTGDLARWLASGELEFLGRGDGQVKVRGFRVELGEIESTLRRHYDVEDAVVLAREDAPGDKRLVAYVVLASRGGEGTGTGTGGPSVSTRELRAYLEAKLPDYMVPSAYVVLAAMPLTATGKIDRRALPAPDGGALLAGRARVAPRGPVEEALAGAFAEVLRIEAAEVGAHDSFFDLGGHSLLGSQVISRVRRAFGIELPLRSLFEAKTPAELAARVSALLGAGQAAAAPSIVRVPRAAHAELPLSFAQERLWFLAQLDPSDPSYVVPLAVRLTGALDAAALQRALSAIVARHEVLRTTFAEVGERPVQVIRPASEVELPVTRWPAEGAEMREALLHRDVVAEARRPFDLAAGPLLRARLFELGEANHVLLLTMHHIVADAWTLGIMRREIAALYEAFHAERPSPLPDLPVEYADYARWQRALLAGPLLEEQLAYWRARLLGAPRVLDLPADRPRPAAPSHRGERRPIAVSAEVTSALKELSRREGATLFMTLLAAFDVLLHRWSGQDDVVVGAPIAGRTRDEIEGLAGVFINTLVLRTEISGELSFRDLLKRVREACLGAYANQDVPFERLVEELAPERDLSRTPLFQVAFVLQNAPGAPLSLPGLEIAPMPVENATAKFDLALELVEGPGGLTGGIELAADLFDTATIDRMIGHLGVILAAIAADPGARVRDLPLMTPAERELVLVAWNRTGADFPREACIHELFEAQAARNPGALAAVCDGATLTYGELDRRANQLAAALRRRGVGPDVLVGVCVERSLETLVAVLGVLMAGGAYVALDPAHPVERLAFAIADTGMRAVLTQERVAAKVSGGAAEVIRLDADWSSIAADSEPRIASGARPGSLAYVIYTSGSTGTPKGVELAHAGLVNLATWHARAYGVGPDDRATLLAAPGFDAAVWEIWPYLVSGASLWIPDEETRGDPARLAAWLVEQGITVTFLPTPLAEAVLADPWPSSTMGAPPGEPGSAPKPPRGRLRAMLTGGDRLQRRPPADLPFRLVNHYGPTEHTVVATAGDVAAAGEGAPSIGRPIANTRIFVVDAHLSPVPIGVPGELLIGGVGLARGYLGRPDLTAERFVASPFADGERLYRTGDLVRARTDGSLEFLRRIDDQVKVRGHRIELGEIEAALARHPAVRECVVAVWEQGAGEKRLAAWMVAAEETRLPAAAELRAFLGQRLPEYMVPAAFVTVERLPLTPNGKVDRRALPAPDPIGEERAYVAPRGPIEEAIAAIFADVLARERVGAHDGFFELGGHSLLATRAIARIRATLGADLPLRALFEAATPAELGARVEDALREGEGVAAPPIAPAARDGDLELSFEQERMWLLHQLDPASSAYVVPVMARLAGALDARALARAIGALARRHEALRTTIAQGDRRARQIVHEAEEIALPVTSLAALSPADREEALRREAAVEAATPFDLAREKPLRARLLAIGPDEHALFLTLHHIVADAWSLGILMREIERLYAAFAARREPELPALPIQYADYARWQRQRLSTAALGEQLAYWRRQLDGAPRALDLPADRPRSPVQTLAGRWAPVTIPPALTRALAELSRREGVTLFMTLLAAFDVLLARWSGQGDVVVGTPIAGRARAETEGLIGCFLNNLALRAKVSEEMTFRELAAQVREACLGAYAHQDVPFERLVEELAPARDLGRSPLFQVFFNLQNAPAAPLSLPGLRVSPIAPENTTTKFELTLILAEGPSGVAGSLSYSTDLFDEATIDRLLAQLLTLLEAIARAPEKRLRELSMLPSGERQRLLVEWNDTASPFPAGERIHDLFEAQVDRTPDAIALVYGDQRITFRALDAWSNQIARRLRKLGVGPDVVVGLCMERSAEIVAAMLGTLKAGGAYLPLDPAYPRQRLAQIVEEAAAQIIVTQAALTASLPEGARLLRIDADAAEIAAESDARVEGGAAAASLAYVLFTSGSTGRPKGVAIEHRNLVDYVRGMESRLALPEGARYAHVSTFSADLGNTVLFPPLCTGGALHVIPEALTTDPDGLAAYFAREEIDCLKIVPSHLSALLSASRPERVLPRRLLVLGGEASSWELVDTIARLAPACRIMNHYGPTETTVGVLTYALRDGRHRDRAPILPLGRPLPNARVYLLDAQRNPVPIGVPGEVFLGGAGVARGYLNQPELTRERFVPDPFSGDPGARLYRTGDRARYLADGTLVFLGRVDFQVKIRGFRVELGEIEAALAASAALRDAVVLVHEEGGDKRLVAYVVPASASPLDVAALARFAGERLPAYMVPASFVALDALPLTPNGKIDRRALAAISFENGAEETDVGPRNPTEEVLHGIWADVFERETIGVHERFSDLGGHSLLAIQIIARAREAFQMQLPLRAVFEAPTIAALAARVDASVREELGLLAPPIGHAPRDAPLALSFAQERLWFLDQLEPESAFYNVPAGMRLAGALDAGALERALHEVVRRHEVLRTTFATVDGKPTQVVHAEASPSLHVEDLSALAPDAREAAARREAAEEARRPFDLGRGPLLRVRLLRLGVDDHVLLLTLHHIVSDAWTRGILNREIGALYEAFRAGRPSPLPELPIQYADYAAWQRGWLRGEVFERQLGYWREQLAGAPPALELPADRPRPPVQSHRGAWIGFEVPAAVASRLAEISRREGVTLFMTLLAAFDVLLHRYTGQDDVVVGSPVANRPRPEVEGLAGFFVNTLVLRTKLTGELTFLELAARVREVCLGAYAHQDMPFERLVTELAPDRDLGRTPLFQVMFMFQSARMDALALPGLTLAPLDVESGTSKFDLTLGLSASASGLAGAFEYATDLFDAATVERMARHLATLLAAIAEDPSRRLSELPLLSAAERARLLGADTPPIAYPSEACIHELFQAQVDRAPDAIAVTFEGRSLTYGELDARANRVAHALRKRGVGPEVRVGLCLDRSIELVVGLLAILAAGGAYVPLDPDYPRERLAFMAEDARVAVIVTEARHEATIAGQGAAIVRLDADADELAKQPATRLPNAARSGRLAYVIYTSGSTGKPKGAMVTHANVARLFAATEAWFRFDAGDVWTLFHSYAFDFSVWEIWGALFHGGRLVVVPYWISRSPDAFLELLRGERVTVLNQTPSAFRQLVRAEESAARAGLPELALRYVIFGGEALDLADLRPFWDRHGDERPSLVNMYGITETTVHVTYRPLHRADLERPWSSVIGRPIPDLAVYILDAHGEPAPIGVPGEMYVGGAGVSRGYLSRPELTAQRFVPSPFVAGARLYRTGDLARWTASGDIEYLGRADQQVKIRGFRIELGEIEAALEAHPAVREAIVVARESEGEKRLVAYLVPAPGARPTAGDLRAFVKLTLPDSMVPSAFVLLDALPLTSNGKIDRRALPAPEEGERAAIGEAFVAPRGAAEEALAGVWASVLRLDRVGVNANFFEVGGDSILSIQIVARARQAGLRITPRQVFQFPTIAELAAAADTTAIVASEQGLVEGPVPLTPIQRWWLEQDLADASHYNQAFLLEAREPIDAAALALAVARLLEHHDALRLRIARGEGGIQQAIAPPGGAPPIARIDLAGVPLADRRAAIEAAAAEAQASLDLAEGPIVKVVLFAAPREKGAISSPAAHDRLLLAIHHLAVDGVSWRILLDDLWSAYEAARLGDAIALPAKTTSYKRWAERLRDRASADDLAREAAYWLAEPRRRAGRLPIDHDRGPNVEAAASRLAVSLDEAETEALLRRVPEAYRTRIDDVLLAALAQALADFTGSARALIDLEGHGREDLFEDVDLTRTVGWFTAIYPVLLDVPRGAGPAEALTSVKEQLRAVPNRGVGYGLLRYLRDDAIAGELRALPQAEVSFNYLGQLDQALPEASPFRVAPESSGPSHGPRAARRYLLDVNASVTAGRLDVWWTWCDGRHRRDTIEALAAGFLARLRALIAHCLSADAGGYTPSDFRRVNLSQAELGEILDEIDDDDAPEA